MNRVVEDFEAVPLLQPVFVEGDCVYDRPGLEEIRRYHERQLELFWPEHLRKLNPEVYRVNLSPAAWQLRMNLIRKYQG